MMWQFFQRAENKNFDPDDHVYFEFTDEEIGVTPEDLAADLESAVTEALEAALALGLPKGSARSACFQIQCDSGVIGREDGKPFRTKTHSPIILTRWE